MNKMTNWLFLLIAYLPFQIALNPGWGFDLASLRLFIVLLFIVWLVKSIIARSLIRVVYFKNFQSIGLLLFLILAGFSLIGAENMFWGLRKIVFFLSIFPLYFLVVALVVNWSQIKKIVSILISGGGIVALIGLGQFLAQFVFGLERVYGFWALNIVPVFSGFNLGALILAYPSWLVNVGGQTILRAFSLFSDPHMLSFYLGLILSLGLILFLAQQNKRRRLLLFVLCFILYVACLLTFARGTYLAIIVTFLILAGLVWKYLKARKAALLLCLSLLVFIIPGTPFSDRFYSSFDLTEGSNVGRLAMWQQAGQAGLEHFWRGVGLGNYSLIVSSDFGYRNPITAHNLYLDIFSEMGLFALVVWLILLLGTAWQLFCKVNVTKVAQGPNSRKGQTLMRIGLIGSLVYFSSHSFFETAIYQPSILALLMVILGLSTVMRIMDYES
jgi:O-antigen ligase